MSGGFLWTNFASLVMPPDMPVSALQREEMRKAFYAGFFEAFKVLNDYAVELPSDQAAKVLEKLDDEAREFFKKMIEEFERSSR